MATSPPVTVQLIDYDSAGKVVAEWTGARWVGAPKDVYVVDGVEWFTNSFRRRQTADGVIVTVLVSRNGA